MFQEKREAYVLKFFFVNIPPSETVSRIFPNTHNFQRFFVSLVEANELHNSAAFKLIWSINGESFVSFKIKTVQ